MSEPITVEIALRTGPVRTIANPTPTPGIVITPALDNLRLNGRWSVTHAASGHAAAGPYSYDWDTAHAIAAALGITGMDWTGDLASVTAQMSEHGARVRDAIKSVHRQASAEALLDAISGGAA